MIFSRELINKNIKYHNWVIKDTYFEKHEYDFDHLSSLVDAYKNLFIANNATVGKTVIIGNKVSIEQIALVLACAELGLVITVIGYPFSVPDHRKQIVNLRYPGSTDFFVVKNNTCTKKFQIFKDICTKTLILDQESLDYAKNDKIYSNDNSTLLKCASDNTGTTDKAIYHTHEFFVNLLQKNSELLYGKIGVSLDNLSHGSNPNMQFLFGLLSDSVTDYYNFNVVRNCNILIAQQLKKNNILLDHLIVPHTHLVEGKFFDSTETLNNCTLYTLGELKKEWVDKFQGKVKDIIRIYGNSETYGPTLITKITQL